MSKTNGAGRNGLGLAGLALAAALGCEGPGAGVDPDVPSAQVQIVQSALHTIGVAWEADGPAPMKFGQVENLAPDNAISGAVQTVVAHPTNADIVYIGAVNGGVWKTANARATRPSWTPLTDGLGSLSIGALDLEPGTPQNLLAGTGRFSSFFQDGGETGALYLSRNGGSSWTVLQPPQIAGDNIRAVSVRGNTLMAGGLAGLVRSTNGGTTFTLVSGAAGTGLPAGMLLDLVADPSGSSRFYCLINGVGLFRSDNGGATWTNVSQNDPGSGGLQEDIESGASNGRLSLGRDGRVYVALVDSDIRIVAFSSNRGTSWTHMDRPLFPDGGLNPGGQGFLHFSIGVDPGNSSFVYLAGDRQPLPSFFGANDFSGRSVRGDSSVPPTGAVPSPQWAHLTHSNAIPQIPSGGTASSSAGHADSRHMAFDANGDLLEVSDGGVVRRTRPRDNQGDWFSLAGNLQVAEMHDVAFDASARVVLGGCQDTGTPEQDAPGSLSWTEFSTADGGDVQVDTVSQPGFSIRYTSFQELLGFSRTTYDAANTEVAREFPALNVTMGDPFFGQFVTPVELNRQNPQRLVIAGGGAIYESFDRGDNLVSLFAGGFARSMVYGHQGNPDALYAIQFGTVLVRLAIDAGLNPTPTPVPDFDAQDVVLDPLDFRRAYVVTGASVFVTPNAGGSWQSITGNLGTLAPGRLRSIEFIPSNTHSLLVVGADRGVFASASNALGTWQEVGTNLPNAPVMDLQFVPSQNRLVISTLGRGAFSARGLAENGSNQGPQARCRSVVVDAGSSCKASVAASAINAGSFDPDGDPFTCTLSPAGPFSVGSTNVTLTCTDNHGGSGSCTAKVVVGVGNTRACCPAGTHVIVGTGGSNQLTGTAGRDCILGLGGDDVIDGRGGNDIISGGSGRDTIAGGFGADLVTGGPDDDIIDSGPDNDSVGGGSGRDTITGSTGVDLVDGGPDDDVCAADNPGDTLVGCEAGEVPPAGGAIAAVSAAVRGAPCRTDGDCGADGLCLSMGNPNRGRCVPRRVGCSGGGCGCLPAKVCQAPLACLPRNGLGICVAPAPSVRKN